MIILLSPTKKQTRVEDYDKLEPILFEDKKNSIQKVLSSLTQDDIKNDYKVSDKLAQSTYDALQNIDESTPALFTYSGEAFKTLDAQSLSEDVLMSANNHMLIFSAYYGLLKPMNPITLYRLDLLNKFEIDLKNHWKETVTDYLNNRNQTLLNLASQEFIQLIDMSALTVPIINIHFLNEKNGKRSVVSSHAKKARGSFARACLINGFKNLESISVEDYHFDYKENNNFYYVKNM